MASKLIASVGLILAVWTSPAAAGADCICRANGTDYHLDDEVCILSAGTPFRARCVMVLNNTSWQRTGDCEQVSLPHRAGRRSGLIARPAPNNGALQSARVPMAVPDDLCEPARWSGNAASRLHLRAGTSD